MRLSTGNTSYFQSRYSIIQCVAPRKKKVSLWHIAYLSERLGKWNTCFRGCERYLARIRLLQPRQYAQQRALSRSGRAEHGHETARRHMNVDVAQYL